MAVLALVGTLAIEAYTHRTTEADAVSRTGSIAAPPGLANASPADEQPTAAATNDPELETEATRARPARRHSRHRAKPSPQRDQAILDPWK